jgi:hypothetical protein
VPVLLPLAGWRADAYDGDLRDWIADRIVAGYPELGTAGYGPHVVEALVAQGPAAAEYPQRCLGPVRASLA